MKTTSVFDKLFLLVLPAIAVVLLAMAAISSEKSKAEHRARCEAAGGRYYHPDRATEGICMKRDAVIP